MNQGCEQTHPRTRPHATARQAAQHTLFVAGGTTTNNNNAEQAHITVNTSYVVNGQLVGLSSPAPKDAVRLWGTGTDGHAGCGGRSGPPPRTRKSLFSTFSTVRRSSPPSAFFSPLRTVI